MVKPGEVYPLVASHNTVRYACDNEMGEDLVLDVAQGVTQQS